MTIIRAGDIAKVETDMAGKRRGWIKRGNEWVMFKLQKTTYTLAELQAIMDKLETAEAEMPARLAAEKLARVREEMAEVGIKEG